ncbi:hypothetical protein chiPu_0021948, partial [Chiloscyllium punctatum]|nr:hypothetical protein [Chiloscyllium punctatum]
MEAKMELRDKALRLTGKSNLSQADSVTQSLSSDPVTEGEVVKLNCTYDTTLSSYVLFWYRQRPGIQPEYLLRKDTNGNVRKAALA